MNEIDVAILSNGQLVDVKTRPVRRLPVSYRRYGIVFRGKVYRIDSYRDANVSARWKIDVESSSYDVDLCPVAADWEGSDAVSSRSIDWFFEDTGYRKYIAMNGDEALLEQVVDRLAEAGIAIVNYGRSMREAEDGEFYDWYIRIDDTGSVPADYATVSQLLSESPQDLQSAQSVVQRLEQLGIELATHVDALTEANDALEVLAADVRPAGLTEEPVGRFGNQPEPASALINALAATFNKEWQGSVGDQSGMLEAKLDATLEILGIDDDDESNATKTLLAVHAVELLAQSWRAAVDTLEETRLYAETLHRKIENLTGERDAAVGALTSRRATPENDEAVTKMSKVIDEQNQQLRNQTEELKTAGELLEEHEDLQTEVELLRRQVQDYRDKIQVVGDPDLVLEAALAELTPQMRYHYNTIDVIARFPDPQRFFRQLASLVRGESPAGVSVGGASGWRELRTSTGQSDDGRFYYRITDGRTDVLVGTKRTQKNDIKRIRRL